MTDKDAFTLAGGAAAVGLLMFWLLFPGDEDPEYDDGPGPNLVIEMAGQASGQIVIDLLPDLAPNHVDRLASLAKGGEYDGVVFHRVIDGFMAQTGDVTYGRQGGDVSQAGAGGSNRPDVAAEFSEVPFVRGIVGMARTGDPNSANSQFFIMFAPAQHLDGQYTVVGRVIGGFEVLDAIKRGDPAQNGLVTDPDYMATVTVEE